MISSIIIVLISLFLDGILSNFLPFMVNDLSLFTPLLTLVSIFLIYPFYIKKEKEYFLFIFILGIIYDLLYTNLLFLNGFLFLEIGCITKLIYRNFENGYFKNIIYLTILIITYEVSFYGLIILFQLVPISIESLVYKIDHSLLLNIIYGEIIYFTVKKLPKKYKNLSIN